MIGTPKKRAEENNVAAGLSKACGPGTAKGDCHLRVWARPGTRCPHVERSQCKMLSPHSWQMSIFLIQRTFPSPAVYDAMSWVLCTKKIIKQTTLDSPSN